MSVPPVSPAATPVSAQSKVAADGDSPAVEAAESAAVKVAEKQNGGFAPKAAEPVAQGVNKVV